MPTAAVATERKRLIADKSLLEALPQEILIKILCAVDHSDLKQLFHVSKAIRKVTLIVKHSHFALRTPSRVHAFRNAIDHLEGSTEIDEIAPDAPRKKRQFRSRPNNRKLAGLSVSLFYGTQGNQWRTIDKQTPPTETERFEDSDLAWKI